MESRGHMIPFPKERQRSKGGVRAEDRSGLRFGKKKKSCRFGTSARTKRLSARCRKEPNKLKTQGSAKIRFHLGTVTLHVKRRESVSRRPSPRQIKTGTGESGHNQEKDDETKLVNSEEEVMLVEVPRRKRNRRRGGGRCGLRHRNCLVQPSHTETPGGISKVGRQRLSEASTRKKQEPPGLR